MKKTNSNNRANRSDAEMLPEYRFDYSKAKPNRFAGKRKVGNRQVLLDADVAEVFQTPESVNDVLRAVIAAMPKKKRHKSAT